MTQSPLPEKPEANTPRHRPPRSSNKGTNSHQTDTQLWAVERISFPVVSASSTMSSSLFRAAIAFVR
jgi:hypothetical protein